MLLHSFIPQVPAHLSNFVDMFCCLRYESFYGIGDLQPPCKSRAIRIQQLLSFKTAEAKPLSYNCITIYHLLTAAVT